MADGRRPLLGCSDQAGPGLPGCVNCRLPCLTAVHLAEWGSIYLDIQNWTDQSLGAFTLSSGHYVRGHSFDMDMRSPFSGLPRYQISR